MPRRRRRSLIIETLLLAFALLSGYALAQEREQNEVEILKGSGQPIEQIDYDVNPEKTATEIIEQTNAFREEQGRVPVEPNEKLTATAQSFADYMAETDRYGHRADGNRASQRAAEQDYDYCIIAENIAYRYNSTGFDSQDLADGLVQGWKDSPGHRENMLDADVRETGVAVAVSKETSYWYAVQLFGRPKSDAIEYEIANRTGREVKYTIGEKEYQLPRRYGRTHMSCRSMPVTFHFSDESEEPETQVKPKNGDRFVIENKGGDLRVEKNPE